MWAQKVYKKEEWNEYVTETNKKGMFRIESKKKKQPNGYLCTASQGCAMTPAPKRKKLSA